MTHGTRTTYIYHECRCKKCKAANAEYQRNRKTTKAKIGKKK